MECQQTIETKNYNMPSFKKCLRVQDEIEFNNTIFKFTSFYTNFAKWYIFIFAINLRKYLTYSFVFFQGKVLVKSMIIWPSHKILSVGRIGLTNLQPNGQPTFPPVGWPRPRWAWTQCCPDRNPPSKQHHSSALRFRLLMGGTHGCCRGGRVCRRHSGRWWCRWLAPGRWWCADRAWSHQLRGAAGLRDLWQQN